MLRPATPLSILLFASFVLLLISVLSTPIIKGIPLAKFGGYNFGVFGYCQDNGPCSGIKIGYTTDELFGGSADFNLDSRARHSLSSLLIVHPIAALCNLIVLTLAIAAHFHSPSHSARYLLALLILLLPTLLVTLLAFLVDILVFVPHVQWGGWIVLASTILITASGVVTCAMRRTLVSRKARKKRIAENAEMSGENFYNRQEHEAKMAAVPTMSTESKVPLVHDGAGADGLPAFTTYDVSRYSEDGKARSQHTHNSGMSPTSPINDEARYYGNPSRSNSRPPPGESGIPMAPITPRGTDGPYRSPQDGRPPGPYSPNGYGVRGGYGPPRGRGGPAPRGGFASRGAYGPRGPPPQGYGRGGFAPDMRGNYGGRGRGGYMGGPMAAGAVGGAMMAGAVSNRGQLPPGYPPRDGNTSPDAYPDGYGSRPAFSNGPPRSSSPYTRAEGQNFEPVSPSQYSTQHENAPATYVAYNSQTQSPGKTASLHSRGQSPAGMRRSPSPPPDMPIIGQAVSTDAADTRAHTYGSNPHDMAGLQHGHDSRESPRMDQTQEYISPRSQWNSEGADVDAPTHHAVTTNNAPTTRPRVGSNASGSYYEDVDPRFAENADVVPALPQRNINVQQHQPSYPPYNGQNANLEVANAPISQSTSYEDLPVGARSPAESETSHFTSVSQRGVNPNWRPGNGGEFNNFGPRRPPQARQDMILGNNPDFELVPPPGRFGVRGGRSGFRGGPTAGAGGRMPPPSALGMNGDSPYPGPTSMREI